MKKSYTSTFKTQVILELLKDEKSLNQLASEYSHVYLHDYGSPREARQQLGDFLHTYNQRRLHEALDYRTPAEAYYQAAAPTI